MPGFLQRLRPAHPPRRWIGLDLGSHSIKLVELEQTPTGARLIKQLIQELPAASEQHPVDVTGWLQSALKEFETRGVQAVVSGPEVAVRRVQMPPMPQRELAEAIKWQVKDQLSFAIQDAVVDVHVIGEVWDKDVKKQDLLVAAASTSAVQDVVGLLERAGARVESVVPARAALWRSVEALAPEFRRGSIAIVNIGAAGTQTIILKDGQVAVERDIPTGCASMTEALVGVVASEKGEVTIDAAKAEALKRRYGILADATQGTTDEGVPLFHLASLMRPVLESLLTELSRFFDFYKVQIDAAGVSRVLLCGGGANLKSLPPYLAEGLGVTVELFNPLVRLPEPVERLEPEQVAEGGPRLAVAIGAALDHGQTLNLLPSEPRRRLAAAPSSKVWRLLGVAVGAALVAGYAILQLISAALGRDIRGLEGQWAALAPAHAQYQTVMKTRRHLEQRFALMQGVLDAEPVWDGVLKALGQLTPAAIRLDEVRFGRDSFTFKGQAAGAASAEGSVAEFIEALERSPFFAKVELASSETRAGATTFELSGFLE